MNTESMASTAKLSASSKPRGNLWLRLLAAAVLLYALLAGLRTVTDYDLFWQLATGRWIAQHHQVFSTDVFS